ncbi:hypothetical protein [Flavobacterium chilense]|uniref:ATP-GRASP peptide maturase, grasp-with-spasm system n=1 Tax=Flavobacterium chilense TaxID=946677 RepID=A0A1M7MW28_9FLAO|nr:hypothetical protein [Flavobacterium chilense]SHM95365.1 hypothetical protein SAMN05444484_11517 [Flavobacterium chilense]
MILILGSDSYEQGTDPVIDWLIYYKAPFLKITLSDLFYNYNELLVDIGNKEIYFKGINLTKEVNVVWYRHFLECFSSAAEKKDLINIRKNKETFNEVKCFMEMFQEFLKDKKWFSGIDAIYLNKLTVLNDAAAAGFKTPYSAIFTSKKEVLEVFEKRKFEKMILKPFSDRSKSYYTIGDESYLSFVQEFSKESVQSLQNHFFPALFQEKIKAEFEIRVFYLDGICMSSAIFIEGGCETDDRKKIMDDSKINVVNYALPETVGGNLKKLMKKLNLMMGSIDLIYTDKCEYVFLEVNPIGQYSYESEKNNFYIEKNIAEHLIGCNNFTKK